MSDASKSPPSLSELRRQFHSDIFASCVRLRSIDVPNMADKDSVPSVGLAFGMTNRIGIKILAGTVTPQRVGSQFALAVRDFLEYTFRTIQRLRQGSWEFTTAQGPHGIANFAQYAHLASIE